MGQRKGRGLDPDTELEIKLDAVARRHSYELTERNEAVADSQNNRRGRTDLLAVAAGSVLGGYLGAPGSTHPADVYAAGLLILTGADPERIAAHVDDVRRAVETPRYG